MIFIPSDIMENSNKKFYRNNLDFRHSRRIYSLRGVHINSVPAKVSEPRLNDRSSFLLFNPYYLINRKGIGDVPPLMMVWVTR